MYDVYSNVVHVVSLGSPLQVKVMCHLKGCASSGVLREPRNEAIYCSGSLTSCDINVSACTLQYRRTDRCTHVQEEH